MPTRTHLISQPLYELVDTGAGPSLALVTPAIEPRDGDVFRFVYSAESWERAKTSFGGSDLNWCFDGQLVYENGRFFDTYWSGYELRSHSHDTGRSFTLADASSKGTLAFVCNLNDVEKINEYDFHLYAEGDAFNLSHQRGCRRYFVKRKGARKDKALMLEALRQKVRDARAEVESAVRHLETAVVRQEQLVPRIEAGEEPYI